jgi:hypothetical protein
MINHLKRIAAVLRGTKGGLNRYIRTSRLSLQSIPLYFSVIFLPFISASPNVAPASPADSQIYWGGYLDGEHYGLGDAPWETRTIEIFEQNAGKRVSIIHWGQFWHWSRQSGYSGIGDGKFQKFDATLYEKVRQRGAIPMINWNSWSADAGGSSNQPNYQLIDITNGNYDSYIRQWARDAKAWGKPLFLRFNHEMNGNWYPWSEQTNGNKPGEYVKMWRHVHDIFRQEGATNVTWVWSVNTVYNTASRNLAGLYPGDSYVDWVAIDGYNWGTNPSKPDQWKSFSQVMTETYDLLGQIAPNKPVMISEFGSTEYGGSKANWTSDALTTQIPSRFPRIKAVVWFNWNAYEGSGRMDWVIESSSSAQNAFKTGIGSSYYAPNNFANLASGKIQPLGTSGQTAPTSTPPPSLPPSGTNLIQNSSFETTGSSWLSPWSFVVGSGAAGSIIQDTSTRSSGTSSARIEVTTAAPTAPWGVQLSQRSLSLAAGTPVTVTFWAKASANREVQVVVQQSSSPYTEYARRSFNLTTSWQQYSFSFTQPVSTSQAMLAFNVAQVTGRTWFDQAALTSGGTVALAAEPTPTATLVSASPTPLPTQTPTPTTAPPTPTPTPTTAPPTQTPTPTSAPPTPTPTTAPLTATNLIQNSSFENTGSSWLAPWSLVIGSGAAGSITQDTSTRSSETSSARIEVTTAAPTAPWGVQLNQRNLSLAAGSPVTVTFWAKASANREVQVVVQQSSSPYTEYARRSFNLTTSWQQYSFSFTQPVSTSQAMLSFNVAQVTGRTWFDQVSLNGTAP